MRGPGSRTRSWPEGAGAAELRLPDSRARACLLSRHCAVARVPTLCRRPRVLMKICSWSPRTRGAPPSNRPRLVRVMWPVRISPPGFALTQVRQLDDDPAVGVRRSECRSRSPIGVGRLLETPLSRTLRPSAVDLRDEAWALLAIRESASDPRIRRDLATRAFELAQSAARLDYDAGQ